MTIDVAQLSGITIRELSELETVMGRPIGALFAALGDGNMSGLDARTLAGLIWLRMRKDQPDLTYDDVLDIDLGSLSAPAGPEVNGGKSFSGPDSVVGITVRLARVWGCSPVALRELTLDELAAMGDVLADEARRRSVATALTLAVVADVAKAVSGIDSVDKQTQTFTDGLKKGAAAVGAFLALDKIQGWANEWIGAARDASKATRQVGIVFDESAADVTKWAKASANALGLTSAEAQKLTVGIGNQLRGYGLDARTAADATTELTERAANVAWVLGKDVSQVLDTVGSALRGRTAGIERAGRQHVDGRYPGPTHGQGAGRAGRRGGVGRPGHRDPESVSREDRAHGRGHQAGRALGAKATTEELKITLGEALLPIVNALIPPLVAVANWARRSDHL